MRKFGIIGSRVWRSEKFRALTTIEARLLYLYLHSSTHGNSAGCFHISPNLIAADTRLDVDAIERGLDDLEAVGLIRRDPREELIQITGFFTFNMPASRKQLAGPLNVIESLPKGQCRDAVCAELAVALYQRSLTFSAEHDATGAFQQRAADLLENGGKKAIERGDLELDDDLRIGLSKDLLINLSIGLPIKRILITEERKEERKREKRNGKGEEEQGRRGDPRGEEGISPKMPEKPNPKKKIPPDDVQNTIAELTRKARGSA